MRAMIVHADEGGCGFYRLQAPGRVLEAQGMDITWDLMATTMGVDVENRQVVRMDALDCDVVILQRAMTRTAVQTIEFIQAQGIAVVVENDDDYWNIDQRSHAFKEFHPRFNPDANYEWLTLASKAADLVTVSTPALARITPNPNVVVLRNCVPAYYLDLEADLGDNWHLVEGRKVVGWTGHPDYHAGDLSVVGNGVARAVRSTGSTFIGIGAEETHAELGFANDEVLYSPWLELDAYPKAVKNFDVGLVPLRMSPFNQCKSYLKGLEYASLGVAFVASPTDEYRRLISLGAGELAAQKHDWSRTLSKLLTNDGYRAERIGEGLDVARELTYEKHAHNWAEAWERAIEIRRAA